MGSMQDFAKLCQLVSLTTKKLEKVSLVAGYFLAHELQDSALAALFLSGRPFPAYEETTLQIGGTSLWRVVAKLSLATDSAMSAAYRKYGDLGSATEEVLSSSKAFQPSGRLTLQEFERTLRRMASARGAAEKSKIATGLLAQCAPLEAKYAVKLMTGDMRIGLRESLVEEAIAKACKEDYGAVRRANMLLGDIATTLVLASQDRLAEAKMRLFHPIGMMLASPIDNAAEAFEYFPEAGRFQLEDKYDGIRAQAHCDGKVARIFSRTLDEISASFPELCAALLAIGEEVILDGEIVAWHRSSPEASGRALPFSDLQQRIGRKSVTAELVQRVPVAFIAFDVLYAEGDLVIDRPLHQRRLLLQEIFSRLGVVHPEFFLPAAEAEDLKQSSLFEPQQPSGDRLPLAQVLLAAVGAASSPAELDQAFDQAQLRGNEGLMLKDVGSQYSPGSRGKAWLKLKRELATLDVVVTAVEYGHGKRARLLSDYTFAVRDTAGGELLNVGKAYSGLTDKEIAELTKYFLAHTITDEGSRRQVEPMLVIEVAFNNVMESDRHASGYALRFPRILRVRTDKTPAEIDTVERVRELFQTQHKRAA